MAKKTATKKLITDVILEAVGEDALDVVFYLKGKSDVSEFTIADDVDLEIHRVRNILYRLNSEHLVTYRRKKDREKGWYISYWTLNLLRIVEMEQILAKRKLVKFRERLEQEEKNEGNYFLCPGACVRMDFPTATDHDFKCPECGSILGQQDNSRTIESLRKTIKDLEKVAA